MPSKNKNNLIGRLAADSWTTRDEIDAVAAEALRRPSLIKDVAALLFHEAPHVQGKAARILAFIAEQQPERVQPYKDILIQEVAHFEHWVARYSFCMAIAR